MNIIASVHLFYPNHCCGSESMLLHVMKYLISKGHNCRVILHQDKNISTPYNYEGIEVFGSKAGGKVDTYRWADCVITQLDFTQFTIIMAAEAKRPLIHFVHNDISYNCIANAFSKVYAVYNSEWISKKIGYNIPGFVLHPPCNAHDYAVGTTGEFITLVSLNERKGGYKLYEIAKAMPDKMFLGVIGSYDNPGPLKMDQMSIINQLIQLPNFKLVANSPDILSVYRQTRILLMPSDYESWGRTATEAMCSGIPVICTPTEGLRENCGAAAIYVGEPIEGEPGDAQVDTGDVKDWVKAIRSLDNPKTYQKYSLACRQRAAELDPVKELEGLESFLHQCVYDYNH